MKSFLLALLIPLALAARAQEQKIVLHLADPDHVQRTDSIPFDSITVFDDRFDRSNIGLSETSAGRIVYQLDRPPAEATEAFFRSVVGEGPHGSGHLFVSIRRFETVGGPLGVAVGVEVFRDAGGGLYERIGSIRRRDAWSFFGSTIVKRFNHTLNRVMGEVVQAVIDSSRIRTGAAALYPIDSVDADVFGIWERRYAIAAAGHLTNGVYHTFADFQQNRADSEECALTIMPDSSYRIFMPNGDNRPVWAVSQNDTLYFPLMGQYILPLSRAGGRFSFYVPDGLPSIAPRAFPASAANTPPLSGNVITDAVGVTMVYGMDYLHDAHLESGRQKTFSRMLAEMKGRWFYLNLENGGWVSKDKVDHIFTKVDISAEFPGGPDKWFDFAQKNFDFMSVSNKITDTTQIFEDSIVVRFVVSRYGGISSVQFLNGNPILLEPTVALLKASPAWEPGSSEGRQLNTYRVLTIGVSIDKSTGRYVIKRPNKWPSTFAQAPVVKTGDGYIRGTIDNGIPVFKGVPYAQPPVGKLRYMPPVGNIHRADTVNASDFGAQSLQSTGNGVSGSENCLYANVYTPALDNGRRPVVVWIHGGSMTNGSGSGMNGHAFADKDNIVTVTINYRLGALGFLYMGDIDKRYAQSGNLGLLDVVAALKWVHENIAAFGGDPGNVTLMGESAGAKLISAVMVAPVSKGLFQQAILESGSVQCIRDTATARNERARLLKQLGLEPGDARKLLDMPADTLIRAQGRICDGLGGNSQFGPVYDGITITDDAYRYAGTGRLSGIRVLMGTNEDEGAAFIGPNADYQHAYARIFEPLFQCNAPLAYAFYKRRLDVDSPYAAAVKTLTQYMYQIHTYRFAAVLSNSGIPVWMYRYKYRGNRPFGARHGNELHYIWDAAKILNATTGSAEKQLAANMHEAWVNFIKAGNPQVKTLSPWPRYGAGAPQVMLFDTTSTVGALGTAYDDPAFPSAVFVIK